MAEGMNPPGAPRGETAREGAREVVGFRDAGFREAGFRLADFLALEAFVALDFLVAAAFFPAVDLLVALDFLVTAAFFAAVDLLADLAFLVAADFLAAVERLADADFLDDFFDDFLAVATLASFSRGNYHSLSLPLERTSNSMCWHQRLRSIGIMAVELDDVGTARISGAAVLAGKS